MSCTPNGSPSKASPSAPLPRGVLGRSGTPLLPGTRKPKQEGCFITSRLPSLRGPRDLTLSGSPGQKRSFAPKVDAPRKAPLGREDEGLERGKGYEGGRGCFNHGGRGSRRGRGGPHPDRAARFIQTQGATFSQGVESTKMSAPGKWNKSESAPVERPKYQRPSSSSQTAEEKIQDEKKLELLLRSDFIDDGHLEMPINCPTTLPLVTPRVPASEWKPVVKVEGGPAIKQEPLNGFALDNAVPSTALNRASLADLCTDPNLPEIGQLLFFQLPDSLPGLQLPADTSQKEAANSIVKVEEQQSHNGLIKLSQFPEGYVGKLQVMKSGRVRLVLGAVALSVDTGTHLSFHQELTSVRLSEVGEADFSVLGHVLHKLICLPDMEQLLAANSQEIS
ncbi:DNA-directed RNA polymerase III subunit RPC4 isoform X1 [Rhipicephalus sanguineus]|uniref:DNA-directed RNA polymerase III subunit RPC4 isoform X1 n=1 Tax=Rhipicephalus sanguineus TaxID=34632 RepID=UPI0018934498|nr:DNA-directed RNA polymerase III subunit RPC4 isoform X1 [Rhipicephalus sanguineus]